MPEKPRLTESQTRVLLFVRIRWAAAALILTVILYLKYIALFNLPLLPNLLLFLAVVAYNLIYPFLVRRFPVFSESAFFSFVRSVLDLAGITALMHFTGGVESPFVMLYLLELASISVFGQTILAYLLAAVAAIFYLGNNLMEALFNLPHYQLTELTQANYLNFNYLLAMTFSLFLTGVLMIYLISYLTGKILRSQQQIEDLSNSRVDFINQVVHEIKGPLTSIIGYAQLFVRDKLGSLDEPQKEPMNVIERQSRRVLDMVNDLLSLARLESGMMKFDKKPASLSDVASRVIEELSPLINSQGVQLVQEFDPATPRLVIDEDKIHEVFTNLISNSLKFCSGSGCRIFVSVAPSGKEVLASVRDEGVGIDPGDLPHIFERFYRASKESSARKGTGLGLAICKSIVEAHGGRMWAASGGLGKGAVFYFALPIPA